MRGATAVSALTALTALASCGRREEPDPPPLARTTPTAQATPTAPTFAGAPTSTPGPMASPLRPTPVTSAATSVAAAVSSGSNASASSVIPIGATTASASSGAGVAQSATPGALRFEGTWLFARFDLDDPATKARWGAIPVDAQREILASAPEARLVVGATTLHTKLAGVPDKTSTYVVEPGGTTAVFVIATSDQGRKEIRLLPGDTMRVLDLDAPGSMATIFRRGN